ncbi:MAG TPA: hypothetical protein VER11_19040 [Polyangiaceae bacterium]|nr:hypothetical protein [Polyangiaceae bacterium]
MADLLGIWGFAGRLMVCSCSLLIACGSSDGGAMTGVLAQAPHCPTDKPALKIEGTIAGAAIVDTRADNDINAGYENATTGRFATPFVSLATLESNQLALTFTWPHALFYGDTSAISGGSLTLPATHPQAGAVYCVSQGQVGFVDGGSEDGALKFAITEVKAGADCSGAPAAVDLRGCDQ